MSDFMQYVTGAIMCVGAVSFAMGILVHKLYDEYKATIQREIEAQSFYSNIFENADYGYATCGGCGQVVPLKNNWEVVDHDCDFSLASRD